MQSFLNLLKGVLKTSYSLKNLSWFKTGGVAEYFFSPDSIEDLIFFLKNKPNDIPFVILGAGSNILITDGIIKGFVLKLNKLNDFYFLENGNIFAQSGSLNLSVANLALLGKDNNSNKEASAKSLGGFEFLSGIPGSIGGAIAMNAGAFGRELKDIFILAKALDYNGNMMDLSLEDLGFSYRKNSLSEPVIFISAVLSGYEDTYENIKQKMDDIKEKREASQPKKVLTGGSTFANPTENNPNNYKAWELLDKVGMRGFRIGDAGFSELHCNFIINYGNAMASDILALIGVAQDRVKQQFNIDLHQEIKFIK